MAVIMTVPVVAFPCLEIDRTANSPVPRSLQMQQCLGLSLCRRVHLSGKQFQLRAYPVDTFGVQAAHDGLEGRNA